MGQRKGSQIRGISASSYLQLCAVRELLGMLRCVEALAQGLGFTV